MALGRVKVRTALRVALGAVMLLFGFVALQSLGTRLFESLAYFPSRTFYAAPGDFGLEAEELSLRSEDGVRLHGFWIAPPGDRALGAILYCHGNGGNVSDRLAHARLLRDAGFGVLLFDYRGYGRSEGHPTEAGTYRDARAAADAVSERAPGTPAFYLGESLGGGVAAQLARERPPRGLVLQSSFTSIRAMARIHYPFLPRFLVPDAYPTRRRLAEIGAPVLVVHGERDRIVPASEGRALYEAAQDPKRLLLFPEAGHNDLVDRVGGRYAEELAAWARSLE
jgi:hypothetical protein